MKIAAVFPEGRDLRLDLLRGVANWAIFLNHMPNNVVNWITTRNYGLAMALICLCSYQDTRQRWFLAG